MDRILPHALIRNDSDSYTKYSSFTAQCWNYDACGCCAS